MVKRNSGEPLYKQIADELRSQIRSGKYPPGSLIPSESEISEKYKVGRITTRKALQVLTDEELITKKQGLGTFVNDSSIHQEMSDLKTIAEVLEAKGVSPKIEVLNFSTLPASDRVSKELQLERDAKVLEIKRLYLIEDSPLCLVNIYLPAKFEELVKPLKKSLPATETTYTVFERAGLIPVEAHYVIKAQEADPETAKSLQVTLGTPILCSERTSFTKDGTPLDFIIFRYRADRFDFSIKVPRMKEILRDDYIFWWEGKYRNRS